MQRRVAGRPFPPLTRRLSVRRMSAPRLSVRPPVLRHSLVEHRRPDGHRLGQRVGETLRGAARRVHHHRAASRRRQQRHMLRGKAGVGPRPPAAGCRLVTARGRAQLRRTRLKDQLPECPSVDCEGRGRVRQGCSARDAAGRRRRSSGGRCGAARRAAQTKEMLDVPQAPQRVLRNLPGETKHQCRGAAGPEGRERRSGGGGGRISPEARALK